MTEDKWQRINSLIAFVKEKFDVELGRQLLYDKWDAVVRYCKGEDKDVFSLLNREDINKIVKMISDDLSLVKKRQYKRKASNKPLTNNGDKLKVAFWFINKIGSPEEALKVMGVAVEAYGALS